MPRLTLVYGTQIKKVYTSFLLIFTKFFEFRFFLFIIMYHEFMRENIIRYEQPNKQNRCKTLKHTTVRRLAAQVVPFSPSTFKLVVVVYPPLFPTARSLYLRYSLSAVCCCAAWQFVYTCVCPRVTFSPHPSLTLLCLWAIFTIVSTQKQELLSCSTLIQKHRLIYPTFHV